MSLPIDTRITDLPSLRASVAELIALDPKLADVEVAAMDLRLRPPNFEAMAEIVISQLVSRAAAATIHGRLRAIVDPFDFATYRAAGDRPREAGLSGSKHATLIGLAQAEPDFEAIAALPPDEAMSRLIAFKGIGPWSAAIFCLFCAGHRDAFPAGDIAVQHAMQDVLGLPERPDAKQAAALATRWAPLRGVATRFLYARYAVLKGGAAAPF